MATSNFYLKSSTGTHPSLIYLVASIGGQRFKYSTGEKVTPLQWNKTKQRVKRTVTGATDLNNYLYKVGADFQSIYRKLKTSGGKISFDAIREELIKVNRPQAVNENTTFTDRYNEYMEGKKGTCTTNTLKKYKTLHNHINEFSKVKKVKVSFDAINHSFGERFISFLQNEKKLLNSSILKDLIALKSFLNWATMNGYNENITYKNFKVKNYGTDIIYLSEEELINLHNLDLSENITLQKVRDFFCFGCFTGLRYSDIAKVRVENIKEDELTIITQKTKVKITIPLNDYAIEILERNNYKLPVISNQRTNDYLKKLGKLADIAEETLITKFRGAEAIASKHPKYELLTTHTARRTFVTLSLEKGMRPETVMEITGHKDYRSMKQYLKITSKIKNIEMKAIWNKPGATLKAVSL